MAIENGGRTALIYSLRDKTGGGASSIGQVLLDFLTPMGGVEWHQLLWHVEGGYRDRGDIIQRICLCMQGRSQALRYLSPPFFWGALAYSGA